MYYVSPEKTNCGSAAVGVSWALVKALQKMASWRSMFKRQKVREQLGS
jgi:hypothetical protein